MLFAEIQSSIIISCDQTKVKNISAVAEEFGIDVTEIGETKSDRFKINLSDSLDIDLSLSKISEKYYLTLGNIMCCLLYTSDAADE